MLSRKSKVWNSLPQTTDFSSVNAFKRSILMGVRTYKRGTVNRGTVKRGQLTAGQLISRTHNRADT